MRYIWYKMEGFLTSEECDNIVSTYSTKEKLEAATVGLEELDGTKRKANICWIKDIELNNKLMGLAISVNSNVFGFNIHPNTPIDMQFTQYGAAYNGFYKEHIDSYLVEDPIRYADRKLSIVVQLTDKKEYEGGTFELHDLFKNEWITIEGFEEKGAALIFPSFFPHRVNPVTKGTRNSLVTWIMGDHFK